jgi:hypothetical protein
MKKFYFLIVLIASVTGINAQELDSLKNIMDKKDNPVKVVIEDNDSFTPIIVDDEGDEVKVTLMDKEIVKVIENGDTTYVKVGDRGIIQVIDQPDSTRIRVGDKEISIVERGDEDADIKFYDVDKDDDEIKNRKFRGHWAGFGLGINNFLDDDFTISREGNDLFMDLNTGRSWAINLNFAQYSFGFGTSHVGLLTGLGLEYNNYFFDRDNSIEEVNDYIVIDSLKGNVAKSKLTTMFLRVPLILEVQFPRTVRAKRIFISGGIVAGLKLGSHTKVILKEESGKNRDKNNDDFNINPFRYGLTARLGYGSVCVYGDYYITPMFVSDKGPDLHPFSIGMTMTF